MLFTWSQYNFILYVSTQRRYLRNLKKIIYCQKIIFFGSTVFGLSTNGDLRSRIRLCVRPSDFFSETAHHIFLKFYMKLGLKKSGKILFIFTILAKNGRKFVFLPKMDGFFWEPHIISFNFFCLKHSLCSRKKVVFTLFLKMSKMALF